MILFVLGGLFVGLAVRNWNRTIGAGPTILIVGGLIVSCYIPIKWNTYQQRLREYDTCAARVERAQETNKFNNVLIGAIETLPNTEELISELRAATPGELTLENDCPREPSWWGIFFEGFGSESPAIGKGNT